MHVLSNHLGMDDDLLHEYVELLTEKQHISEMTVMDAIRVIDSLEGRKSYYAGNHMTSKQEGYIFLLMKNIGWTNEAGEPDERRLDGFVKKQYGIDSHRFMDRKTASNVIEFLKEMDSRMKKGHKQTRQA
jgi:hypothetical protein